MSYHDSCLDFNGETLRCQMFISSERVMQFSTWLDRVFTCWMVAFCPGLMLIRTICSFGGLVLFPGGSSGQKPNSWGHFGHTSGLQVQSTSRLTSNFGKCLEKLGTTGSRLLLKWSFQASSLTYLATSPAIRCWAGSSCVTLMSQNASILLSSPSCMYIAIYF